MRTFIALAALAWLGLATDAFAHASLVATEPRDGSVTAKAPKMVQLRFNEPVTPAVISLIDAEGRTRDDTVVHAVDETIDITLPKGLPQGTQVVSYRVISADGHPVGGSMVFSIGMPSGKSAALPTNSDSVLATLIWLSRIGLYLGLFVGVGGAFFAAWIAADRVRSTATDVALAIGLFGAAASAGLQGLDLLGLPIRAIFTAAPWQAGVATSLGPTLLVAAVAMGLSLIAPRLASGAIARALSAFAMTGVGLSLALSGHAGTAPPQWLTRPAIFLHGGGIAYWVGALLPLAALARRPGQTLLPVLNRFSRVAVPAVGLLVLTGLILAIVQLDSFRALIDTRYGLILSIKVALVVVLTGFAALNRFRLVPALQSDPGKTRRLRRSIAIECAIVVGILGLVAGWRFTPPPRSLATPAPLAVHIHSGKATLQVLVSPGTAGNDTFVLQLVAEDARPLEAKEVTLVLSLPERGIEPFERQATRETPGHWFVRDVPLPFAGRWRVRVDALVTDFEKITLEDDLDVPAR